MATIKDVAKRAGVAISTASYALNGHDKIKGATRERVLQAAKELNYRKNGLARDLKMSKTNTIALILSDLVGPFYSELIRGVQELVLEKGYDLIVCSSYGDESSTAAKFLRETRVDGVILLAHNIKSDFIRESAREGFPIIVLDRYLTDNPHIVSINVNNHEGAYEATNYLIDKGKSSIAFISGPQVSADSHDRLAGYRQALKDRGLTYHSKWTINGKFTQEGGYQATQMLIHQGGIPDAIFYANDEMAIGGLDALKDHNISVPKEISIIGFDDIQIAAYLHPQLTTMRQPKYEIGKLASHVIFQILEGQDVKNYYSLSTEMIYRESVSD